MNRCLERQRDQRAVLQPNVGNDQRQERLCAPIGSRFPGLLVALVSVFFFKRHNRTLIGGFFFFSHSNVVVFFLQMCTVCFLFLYTDTVLEFVESFKGILKSYFVCGQKYSDAIKVIAVARSAN